MAGGSTPDEPASELLDRWQSHRDPTHTSPPPPPSSPPPAESPADSPASPPTSPSDAATVGVSTDVDFTPRLAVRRVVGAVTLVALAATVGAGYLTFDDRTPVRVGVTAGLAVLTLVLWAVLTTSPTARLSIHSGQLEVRRGAARIVVDLRSSYTPIEVVGRPGSMGWKVLLGRVDGPPFVIDSSMVDAERLTAELRRYRPTL